MKLFLGELVPYDLHWVVCIQTHLLFSLVVHTWRYHLNFNEEQPIDSLRAKLIFALLGMPK